MNSIKRILANFRKFPFLLITLIMMLLVIGSYAFGDLIFTPSNHQFALYDIQSGSTSPPLVFVRNTNIVGSTYFNDSTSSYIGFLTTRSSYSPSTITFNYFSFSNETGWNNLKSVQRVALFTGNSSQLLVVNGLTCVSINGTNVFTTILSVYPDNHSDRESYRLISFFLNGTLKSNHLITGVADRYFHLEGITSLNNGSYSCFSGKLFQNPSSSITWRTILTVNSTGSIQREIILDEEIHSLVFMKTNSSTEFLWTGGRNEINFWFKTYSLSERDESGTVINIHSIKYSPTEMDFLAPGVLLIRRARQTYFTFDVYDAIPVVTFLAIVLLLTTLLVKKRRSSRGRSPSTKNNGE